LTGSLLDQNNNWCGIIGMKNEARKVIARKAWERPALYRMDAADASSHNSMLDIEAMSMS
jgi:hypothetical protein